MACLVRLFVYDRCSSWPFKIAEFRMEPVCRVAGLDIPSKVQNVYIHLKNRVHIPLETLHFKGFVRNWK